MFSTQLTNQYIGVSALMLALMASFSSWAGGIALGGTRVIYPADAKQTSLSINNSDKQATFLIQTWVENESGNKTDDFIVTPPLFVSKPASENTLRIIYGGGKLPTDRETLYWLNSKSIPSVNREDIKGKNVLQIAVLARIKMFVRPAGLTEKSADAPGMLTFTRNGDNLTITNPSPFFVTLVNMTMGGRNVKVNNTMVSPKSSAQIPLFNGSAGMFTYQTINDYGAMTPVTKVQVN